MWNRWLRKLQLRVRQLRQNKTPACRGFYFSELVSKPTFFPIGIHFHFVVSYQWMKVGLIHFVVHRHDPGLTQYTFHRRGKTRYLFPFFLNFFAVLIDVIFCHLKSRSLAVNFKWAHFLEFTHLRCQTKLFSDQYSRVYDHTTTFPFRVFFQQLIECRTHCFLWCFTIKLNLIWLHSPCQLQLTARLH